MFNSAHFFRSNEKHHIFSGHYWKTIVAQHLSKSRIEGGHLREVINELTCAITEITPLFKIDKTHVRCFLLVEYWESLAKMSLVLCGGVIQLRVSGYQMMKRNQLCSSWCNFHSNSYVLSRIWFFFPVCFIIFFFKFQIFTHLDLIFQHVLLILSKISKRKLNEAS